jgi:hypothetical protein
MASVSAVFAPIPDFRYVGLEPVMLPSIRSAATALGLGAGVSLALSGLDGRHALVAGAFTAIMSALALRGAGTPKPASDSARMAIVPWGVLVETAETPRILRWAGVRKIGIETSRAHHILAGPALSSRVVIETERDRFVGETAGVVPLERLMEHLDAYASEQSAPLALQLDGDDNTDPLESIELSCESLIASARDWLETASASVRLGLSPAGYRRASLLTPTPVAVDVLRRTLRDRTPRLADPRAFAAVVAAELHATALLPDLFALTQCPHPLVAAFAKQAARKLGASEARTGTLDEVAPFLMDGDRARLESWLR